MKPNTLLRMSALLGPKYSYADELKTPSQIGVKQSGSVGGVLDAIAGVNYYVDTIGFGHATQFAKKRGMRQTPLGVRFFVDTGIKCSNGQPMHEYIDTIPKPLGGKIGREIQRSLGVPFQGLAPGIVQDATQALNPVPLFRAATGSGYAKCKKVTLPVGDFNGRLVGSEGNRWIQTPVQMIRNRPHQSRWVYDRDISQDAYNADPKIIEGFESQNTSIAAGVLCAALILGIMLAVRI
jgi:hypothetical protein